jgi:RNA polymerase sigma-70 factor (ECF subfamily)
MTPDDKRLLARLRAGDRAAQVEIVESHMRDAFHFLCMLTQEREVAADLTQETMVQVWRGLKRFRGDCRLSTWIKKIAVNEYRQYLRRVKRRSAEVSCDLPDTASDVNLAEAVVDEDTRRLVRKAVGALPTLYREVVVMHCYGEAPLKTVAKTLDVPLGTVKWRLSRAIRILRTRIAAATQGEETRGRTDATEGSLSAGHAQRLDEEKRRVVVRPRP